MQLQVDGHSCRRLVVSPPVLQPGHQGTHGTLWLHGGRPNVRNNLDLSCDPRPGWHVDLSFCAQRLAHPRPRFCCQRGLMCDDDDDGLLLSL
jgi:hypothetical protein